MAGKFNGTSQQATTRKPYEKPTLIKGPVLSQVTALTTATVSGVLSDSAPACWVARAAFGESDIRWMIFRGWLLDDAPAWFRRLYIRHGETVGSWLARRNFSMATDAGLLTARRHEVAEGIGVLPVVVPEAW